MVGFSALVCPGCGAPLPADALLSVVTCGYCHATVAAEDGLVSAAAFRAAQAQLDDEARARADLVVAGVPYLTLGPLARGKRADVVLAQRAYRITERVVVKLLHDPADAARLQHEHDVLRQLNASEIQGAPQMTKRLPQPVAFGSASLAGGEARPALVMRAASGFIHTFADVRAAYPSGLDGRHAVWMWRRILELFGWIHRAGWAHGALEPHHLLVHARDHGVMPIGWSSAARITRAGQVEADIVLSARCIAYLLAPSVPAPIAALVESTIRVAPSGDAWSLERAVCEAARHAYGPVRYEPLRMPGWK